MGCRASPGLGTERQELQEWRTEADLARGGMGSKGLCAWRGGLRTLLAQLEIPPNMDGSGPF